MENTKIEKIKKAAGVTAKVLNVVKVIMIVGMVFCIVGGISAMCIRMGDEGKTVEVFGSKIVIHNMVSIGDLNGNLHVEGFNFLDYLHIEDPFVLFGAKCFCAAIMILLEIIVVVLIRGTFTAIQESDTPFKPEILKKVKFTGILVTLIVLMHSIGTAAIVALSFWFIYCIFDYGIELQTDADETL